MLKFFPLGIAVFSMAVPFKRWIGSAITGGAGLASSLISAASQNSSNKSYLKGVRETNEANLQIARETNQLNRDLYNQQVGDNRINWMMQNAYESPAAQLARLRNAGINSYESGSFQPVSSASPNAAVGATMQAPGQTPNPYSGLNLGGVASDVLAALQSEQKIKSDNMDLYIKGIDKQFYLESKISDLQLKQYELEQAGLDSDMKRQQFSRNAIEIAQYEEQLSLQRTMNTETIKNLRVTRLRDKQRMQDDHSLAMASIKQMDSETAVKWFQAHTDRYIAKSVYERNMNEAGKLFSEQLINDARESRDRVKFWSDYFHDLKLREWSYEDREAYKQSVMYQLAQHAHEVNAMNERERSAFLHGLRLIFGTDTEQIFKGAGINYSLSGSTKAK